MSTETLKEYYIGGNLNAKVEAGETVVMRCLDKDDGTCVARVRGFRAAPNEPVKVEVQRYYRPEDTCAGRKPFHGSRELFLTHHYDSQDASTIVGKCILHSFTTYTGGADVGPNDYFYRLEYHTDSGLFSPDAIEVVCKCEMPVNPDVFMLKCEACRELYHPACINMPIDQAKQLVDNYTCEGCPSLDGSEGSASTDLSMVKSKRTKY